MTRTDDSRLATIRSLLAKAESTPYSEEAEAFTAKATELMARYAIDAALLWADGTSTSTPGLIHIDLTRPFTPNKAILVTQIATAFGCEAVRLERLDPGGERVAVVGFPEDLEMVRLLVSSLLVQLTTAMAAAMARTPPPARHARPTAAEVASWRRSFIMGYVHAVTGRLRDERERARRERDGATDVGRPSKAGARSPETRRSAALVLADRKQTVREEYRRRFPNVRVSSVSGGRSAAGRAAGSEAGERADLGAGRLSGRAAIGP